MLMLALQIGIVFHTPCTCKYYPSHLSRRPVCQPKHWGR